MNKFNCEENKKKNTKEKQKKFNCKLDRFDFEEKEREERDCGKRDGNEVEDDESWGAIIIFSNG